MSEASISEKFLGDFLQKGAYGHSECIGGSEQTQYRDMSVASISQKFLVPLFTKSGEKKRKQTIT